MRERRAEAARLLATQAHDKSAFAEYKRAVRGQRQAARKAGQQAAALSVTSNGGRKRLAGHVALERLIGAHREEFALYLSEAHAELDVPDERTLKVRRLVAAGLTWRAAEDFAERKWPEGDLSDGIRLTVEDGPVTGSEKS